MEKCGLKFDHYGEYTKLDGSQTFKAKFYKTPLSVLIAPI
jgi:ribosomal-protein-alanine N-acetyltransferase